MPYIHSHSEEDWCELVNWLTPIHIQGDDNLLRSIAPSLPSMAPSLPSMSRNSLHYYQVLTVCPLWLKGRLCSDIKKKKKSACNGGKLGFDPWVGKIPWRREWQPTPVFLPVEFHGQWSPVGYSPWGFRIEHDWAIIMPRESSGNYAQWKFHSNSKRLHTTWFHLHVVFGKTKIKK